MYITKIWEPHVLLLSLPLPPLFLSQTLSFFKSFFLSPTFSLTLFLFSLFLYLSLSPLFLSYFDLSIGNCQIILLCCKIVTDHNCTWMTYYPDLSYCELLANCSSLDTQQCDNCLSAQHECISDEKACFVKGTIQILRHTFLPIFSPPPPTPMTHLVSFPLPLPSWCDKYFYLQQNLQHFFYNF